MSVEFDDGDAGFTMLELIVVVLLVGVIASVMVAVVAVILRNAPATEAQADNSRSYQGLLTWLPRDVASTAPQKFKIDTTVPTSPAWTCSDAPAAPLVEMSWNQQGTAYVAGYSGSSTETGGSSSATHAKDSMLLSRHFRA